MTKRKRITRLLKRELTTVRPMFLLLLAYEVAIVLLMVARLGLGPFDLGSELDGPEVVLWVFLLFLPVVVPSIQTLNLALPGGTKVEIKRLTARLDEEKKRIDRLTYDVQRTVHSLVSLKFTPDEVQRATVDRLVADGTVKIGCQEFTEQRLLCAILAEFLEDTQEFRKVIPRYNVGGAARNFVALARGEIDILPTYTWTGFEILYPSGLAGEALRREWVGMDAEEMVAKLNTIFAVEPYPLEWLCHLGFHDNWQMVIRTSMAEKEGIEKLSDLTDLCHDLVLGCESDFLVRSNGLGVLHRQPPVGYGLRFREIKTYKHEDIYAALRDKEVDIVDGFTTDPEIQIRSRFTALKDTERRFGQYHAAVVARVPFIKACEQEGIDIRSLLKSDKLRFDATDGSAMNELCTMIRDADQVRDEALHLHVVRDLARDYLDRRGF